MRRGIRITLAICSELSLQQMLRRVTSAETERNRGPEHQCAECDGKRGQHHSGRKTELLERHHDTDADHQQPQRAAQQSRTRDARIDRRQQCGPPQEIADEKTEREHQERDEEPRHEPEELIDEALKRRELQRVQR